MERRNIALCSTLLFALTACVTQPLPKVESPEQKPEEPKKAEPEVKVQTPEEIESFLTQNRAKNTKGTSKSIAKRMQLKKGQKQSFVTVQMNGIDFTFEDRNGLAVIDDMILGETQEVKALALQRSVISGKPWTTRLIPYQYDSTFPQSHRAEFERAVKYWNDNSVVRLYLRRPAPAGGVSPDPDYVLVQNTLNDKGEEQGCFANLGRVGGEQPINLGAGCVFHQYIHEIGHTVGLVHEQNRIDRDDYVIYYPERVVDPKPGEQDKERQFLKTATANLPLEFDTQSRMLYQSTAFAADPKKPVLTRKDGTTWNAQTRSMSPGDLETVGEIYGYRVAPREKRYKIKSGTVCVSPSRVSPLNGEAMIPASPFNDTRLMATRCATLAAAPMIEKWRPRADGSIRGYAGKCFDTSGGSSEEGAGITMKACPDAGPLDSQKWTIKDDGSIQGIGGLCLTLVGVNKQLILSKCVLPIAANQKWQLEEIAPLLPTQPDAPK